MWDSSDESDTNQKTSFSQKPGSKPPASALSASSASKTKPSKSVKALLSGKDSSKPQYMFCANSSDSLSDSDSSSASNAKTDHGNVGAQATVTGKASVSGKQPVSTQESKSYASSKTPPDVRPKTYSDKQTKPAKTYSDKKILPAWGSVKAAPAGSSRKEHAPAGSSRKEHAPAGSSRKEHVIQDYSMEYPTLALSVSSYKENVKQPGSGSVSKVPTPVNPGKKRSFEKFDRSDRGQQYSKREEKFNLNDFMPKTLRDKTQKQRHGKHKPERFGEGSYTEGISDRVQGAGLEVVSDPSGSLSRTEKKREVTGGMKNRSRAPHKQGHSNFTDDSEDESLSILLSSHLQFVPPLRQAGRDADGSKEDFPVVDGGADGSGTRPGHTGGARSGGQRSGNDADMGFFGRREENQQGRREQDNDNGDNRHNWRDNQNNRNPQNNNWNGNRRENRHNRRDNPLHRNAPNDNVHEGQNRAQPVPPPRENDQEEEGPRNAPRRHQDQGHERGGGNRQRHRPQPEGLRPLEANLSFTRLRELKTKQPAEVVAALSYSREGLSRLLKNEQKLTTDAPLMKLLLSSLAKACQCNSMPTQLGEILNLVRTSAFLRFLGTFLTTTSVAGETKELTDIFGESADLLRMLVTLFPSCLHDVVMVHAFMEIAQKQIMTRGGGELPENVAKKVDELNMAKDAAMEGLQQKEAKKSGVVDEDSLTPPDDFRRISVFPTMDDLNKEELPFLRKNKRTGGYTGMDHYLDVQFRLMREDFVYPLREGIAEYLAMIAAPNQGRRLKDIRVYHNVHILRAVCLQSSLGHRLTFDVSRMKRVRWEVSKRLIYGSLVCLSADNFQTLYFATVSNREASDLREGMVDVTFEHILEEVAAIPPETTFTMAETTAFFEAYRHVLSGLQRMQGNQLPFQKYIVKCDKAVTEPSYLTNNEAATVEYDLRPLVDDSVKLREDGKLRLQRREVTYEFSSESQPANNVPVLHRELWPDPGLLHLDESQFEALHRALTKEFSIIQGPPGTGKTYVGLKIVKALLHNRKCWDPDLSSCMLIVCYTNHALDQFLEGVISFFNGGVVRVGSRLRSEVLESFTLNKLRWSMRRQREDVDRDFREITRLRFQGHEAMDSLKKEIDTMGLKIESAKREILHEEVLMPYMLEKHYRRLLDARYYLARQGNFVKQGKTKKKVFSIPEWLGIGAVMQNRQMMAQQLHMLDQELGEEEMDIEGEVQALEEQNRLDTEDTGDRNDKQKKEKEKKKALAQERSTYLALDVSRLDQGLDDMEEQRGGDGGGGFQITRAQWKKLKRKLRRNVELDDRMTDIEERQVRDLWSLDIQQRWRLYRRWTHNLCQALKMEMSERERLYDDLAHRQQETLMQEDKHILKTATVIAMTTTAAARYQSVLQEVKPKVIVVEEAAEVLEGHVITTLSQDCQHLILIGDHKQLRPNPTVYTLARKYNLELSLFERMINNGLRCTTLGWQHRMRPEIAALVKPIYPELNNHPSVESYEPVRGVSNNVYFINHAEPEAHDDETKSHSNLYEAHYLAMLCQYLIKQGYDPSRITVLTTYSGQLFHLRKLMPKKSIYEGVRVTVVDNFQGEENDIILLSLVRSNEEGNIGFLKIENRVCVALSRAKMGLYVIGNFDLLSAESELWQSITTGLRREGKIGETLNLYCQNHPHDRGLTIRWPEDFDWAPEGGCMKPCKARLNCGHVCQMMCHPYDKDHVEYKCTKTCGRKMDCEFGHICQKQCYQDCGECQVRVERTIPKCCHMQWMHCSQDPKEFICQEKCLLILACGHQCSDVCGERHKCLEKVQHTWPCGHTAEVPCAQKNTIPCKHPCGQTLACGHQCSGTCSECHGGRLHQQCQNNCTKILVCGHSCRDACSNCPPCGHKCENSCVHSSCQRSCGLPCAPCKEPCAWQCPHHSCNKLCSEPCDRPVCDEPCVELLPCDHPCIGLCGEPCPQLCRVCNAEQVTNIFFGTEDEPDARFVQLEDCQHVLEVSGLDRWMMTTTDTHEDSIQLKSCPHCKTPIRRNLRYGAIIKTQLNDIETVKSKMLGDEDKREDTLTEVELMIDDETDPTYEDMKKEIKREGDADSLGGLVAMVNQMTFLEETKKLSLLRKKKNVTSLSFSLALGKFETWLCKKRSVFSEQESQDAQTEMLRLKHWLALQIYNTLAQARDIKLPDKVLHPLTDTLQRMKEGLPYEESHQVATPEILKILEELVPESGLGVSEEERVMIVKAMALNQGHWFKCPQGHVYAIADCGGATVESRCPDCNATIGGTQHRVRNDNTLATEMDGATRPAWPTTLDEVINNDDVLDLDDLF